MPHKMFSSTPYDVFACPKLKNTALGDHSSKHNLNKLQIIRHFHPSKRRLSNISRIKRTREWALEVTLLLAVGKTKNRTNGSQKLRINFSLRFRRLCDRRRPC
jgi:hypothetical protein